MAAIDASPLAEQRTWPHPRLAFVVPFVVFALVAFADGGYFAPATACVAVAAGWLLLFGLAWRRAPGPTAAQTFLLLGLGGIALLTAVHGATPELELLRIVGYGFVAACALLLVDRGDVEAGFAATVVVATVVAGYALATRLFPDRLGVYDDIAVYRLAEPLGYWNALGILCVIGAVVALGTAAHGRSLLGRALAGGAIPILVITLYFTFSRGSWIAFVLGLAGVVALSPRRLWALGVALALAAVCAVAVALAASQDALITVDAPLAEANSQGRNLAVWLVLLIAGSALGTTALALAERRLSVSRRGRLAFTIAVVAGAVGIGAVGIARFGTPWTIATDAYDSFTSPPPKVQSLNDRLFTFSSNGRIELWEAAWNNYKDHPLTGSGAGTFEQYWLEHREVGLKVRDAHSLYLETLSELGPLGLALLLLALGVPVYAAFKARGHPLVPAAFGAYVAYLVHAGVDWDWEMPAVTITAFFIGASIVVAARKPEDEEKTMSPRLRYGLLTGTLALAAVAFVGLVGNMALAQAADAARAGDWEKSESKARRAETWAPWSPEPWQRIGEAQLARGELADARASFRAAIEHDERDWELWLDLARASQGRAQLAALAQATKLNPLSPEVAQLRKELAELGTIEVGG